jgi:hypothetical protein
VSACPQCGADPRRVAKILASAEFDFPATQSLWDDLLGRDQSVPPVCEALWAEVSLDFKRSLLNDYRLNQLRARGRTTALLLPVILLLQATSFWIGIVLGQSIGIPGGKLTEFFCGVAATVVLGLTLLFTVGSTVEGWLLESQWERNANRPIANMALVGPVIVTRCRVPWFLNPDFLFPLSFLAVLGVGWFVL